MKEKRATQVFSEETKRKMSETQKGRTVPQERRKRISLSHTGKKRSPEHIRASALGHRGITINAIRGEKHWNWKGGISSENHIFRNRVEYKEWRRNVFERDKYTCKMPGCGQWGGKLEANHIKLFSEFPKLRLVISNGITLCKTHHRSIRQKELEYEELFLSIVDEYEKP